MESLDLATAKRRGKLIAFGWYGGKFSHLNWLLPLLPECHHYCEPFAGSAAVLLNREPSPVETYNDIDGEVANFFRVLRDHKKALIEAIGLTPFSREELFLAVSKPNDSVSEIERARRFFVRARQTRTGLAQTSSLGRWANCKNTSRAGMSGVVSRWLGSVEALPAIALRLLRVQIENRPALEVIKLYDDRKTLFYCDPPYVHSTRGDSKAYGFEMTDKAHSELAATLKRAKGKVVLSGYRGDLMDTLYKDWTCVEAPPKHCHSIKKCALRHCGSTISAMGRKLDYPTASAILEEHFPAAERMFADAAVIDLPESVATATERLFSSATQAFREALIGCSLARIIDPEIDIRFPYMKQAPNSFNGRTLDKKVVNPFLVAHTSSRTRRSGDQSGRRYRRNP